MLIGSDFNSLSHLGNRGVFHLTPAAHQDRNGAARPRQSPDSVDWGVSLVILLPKESYF